MIPIGQANRTNVVASGLTQAIACDFIYEDKLIFWMEDAMDYGKVNVITKQKMSFGIIFPIDSFSQ